MRLPQYRVTCHVCGEEGIGDHRTAGAEWYGFVSHADPQVCADNLAAKEVKKTNEVKA